MEYSKRTAFINRKGELGFLEEWVLEEPEHILFIYGPKSSGKTTLLKRFVHSKIKRKEFEFKSINLRKIFISGYKDFLRAFFGVDDSGKKADVKKVKEVNLKVFKLSYEVLEGLEKGLLDPFTVMESELKKLNKKGKLPILILDELQALEDIYLNGQRLLIKELFNFFVAMTKESHLCHIIICGSDGYFMERIYNDSRLRKTSDFFKVDYLPKEDVMYWLDNLEKESCIKDYLLDAGQKEAVWEMFGGSMWEISRFLGDLLLHAEDSRVPDKAFDEIIEKRKIQMRSHFVEYAGLNTARRELCSAMHNEIGGKGFFTLDDFKHLLNPQFFSDESLIRGELGGLVSNNFIAYDPLTAQYSMQGKSMEHGLRMYCEGRMENGDRRKDLE